MNMQTDLKQLSEDYLRIEQAILYLENHYTDQPGLEQVAADAGLSEYHFQRLFPLGRRQPQAFSAISDERRRKGVAQPIRESAGYYASSRTIEFGTPPRSLCHRGGGHT